MVRVHQKLEDADAALIAGIAAVVAALAMVKRPGCGFRGGEMKREELFFGGLVRLLALRADHADEALREDRDDRLS
jgi:hypothetical protein